MTKFTVQIQDENTEHLIAFLVSDLEVDSNAAQILKKDVIKLLDITGAAAFNMNLPTYRVYTGTTGESSISTPLFLPTPYVTVFRVREQTIEVMRIYHTATGPALKSSAHTHRRKCLLNANPCF
jgi:hypothetical protein